MTAGIAGREKRHSFKDRGDDFYPSPREAVDALIRLERPYLPQRLWEPACGDGAIVQPFREAGYSVHATDLVARGCPDSESGVDFLLPVVVPEGIGGVVTNPPFKFARQFVDKALGFSPYVAMLLRLSFLEGSARRPWFESITARSRSRLLQAAADDASRRLGGSHGVLRHRVRLVRVGPAPRGPPAHSLVRLARGRQ